MSKTPRRGGLGRGLGALIPTAPATTDPVGSADDPVMSTEAENRDGAPAGTTSARSAQQSGAGIKVVNRVPSIAAIAASSATDFYFDPSPVPGASLREVRPDQISTNPKQPRQVFDEDALAELAHSIKEFGVLQPIVVRAQGDGFELVMGERRLRAAILAGLDKIPAIVRDTADDAMLRDALLENIHRAQLNPLEEAAAYQQLLEEFGVTHEELASRIGRSRSQVSNTIRLMNLPVAGPAAGCRRRAVSRTCPGTARPGQPRSAGRPGRPDRRRGPIGTRHRGTGGAGRHRIRRRAGAWPAQAAARRSPRRRSASWPTSCLTRWTPGYGWSSAGARARSPSSSVRSMTSNGSSRSSRLAWPPAASRPQTDPAVD